MRDFLISLVLFPLRWSLYAILLAGMVAGLSVVCFLIGPLIIAAMLLDPSISLWVPLAFTVGGFLCGGALFVFSEVGPDPEDSYFLPNPATVSADLTLLLCGFIWYVIQVRTAAGA